MPRDPDEYDAADWDDPESDTDDGESDDWEDDESEEPTKLCYYCRAEIHEDLERCPECGNYQSEEDAPTQRKPVWLVAGVILCLLVILWWVFPLLFS